MEINDTLNLNRPRLRSLTSNFVFIRSLTVINLIFTIYSVYIDLLSTCSTQLMSLLTISQLLRRWYGSFINQYESAD